MKKSNIKPIITTTAVVIISITLALYVRYIENKYLTIPLFVPLISLIIGWIYCIVKLIFDLFFDNG